MPLQSGGGGGFVLSPHTVTRLRHRDSSFIHSLFWRETSQTGPRHLLSLSRLGRGYNHYICLRLQHGGTKYVTIQMGVLLLPERLYHLWITHHCDLYPEPEQKMPG
jgi:hypothetical protein